MRSLFIGRVLGTGVRVAGKMVGERLAAATEPDPVPQFQSHSGTQTQSVGNTAVHKAKSSAAKAAQASGGVARGVGGFLRPFRRVGGILWLEVTGVFFLLPVVAFAPNLLRMRASWAHGPDHRTFLVTALVVAVFLYLGLSSFWRARRK